MPSALRALIVDDERAARLRLTRLLTPDDRVEVVGEAADGATMLRLIRELHPDLLFLDVEMTGLDGVTAFGHLAPNERPAVIFVTAHPQYAVQAFEVRAIDYLLKPVHPSRLSEAVGRILATSSIEGTVPLSTSAHSTASTLGTDTTSRRPVLRRMLLPGGNAMQLVDACEIEYVTSNGNYVALHVRNQDVLLRQTMDGLQTRLDPAQFVRIHRKYIVNIDCVSTVSEWFGGEYSIRTHSGADLRLSRSYRDAFFDRIDPGRSLR